MSYLLSPSTSTRFFVEIKDNNLPKDRKKTGIFDALARNIGEATIELVSYDYFPVGAILSIERMQEKILGRVIQSEPCVQGLTVLIVRIFFILD